MKPILIVLAAMGLACLVLAVTGLLCIPEVV